MSLDLDWTGSRQRLVFLKKIGQWLVVYNKLFVEHNGHSILLHANARGIPFACRFIGFLQWKFSGRFSRVVPKATGSFLATVLKITLAIWVPDLDLRIATQIDAAIGTRSRQHPLNQQFTIAVVASGGEKNPLAIAHDFAFFHFPMRSHVVVVCLPLGHLLRSGTACVFARILMRPTTPTGEITTIEK